MGHWLKSKRVDCFDRHEIHKQKQRVFIRDGEGEATCGRRSIPAEEYYSHLSRMLIRLMSERTEHGLVWLMDMRLRPGGDGTAICMNLDATVS